jgi:7-cyano-7-deazaguanine synthase
MRKLNKDSVLVLLSGGQDSATCLSWAMTRFKEIYTISFNYGQKHIQELKYSKILSDLAGAKIHIELNIKELFSQVTSSALMDKSKNVSSNSEFDETLPASFVPFRNMQFLLNAGSIAYIYNIKNLITGVCQTDFSGYPDCRDNFIKSMNITLNLAGDCDLDIYTPLMWLTKSETIKLMQSLGTIDWYKYTITCYNGTNCGTCPSCKLRIKGFKEAGIKDPIEYC